MKQNVHILSQIKSYIEPRIVMKSIVLSVQAEKLANRTYSRGTTTEHS